MFSLLLHLGYKRKFLLIAFVAVKYLKGNKISTNKLWENVFHEFNKQI